MKTILLLIISYLTLFNMYLIGNEHGFKQGLEEGHADCILNGLNLKHNGVKV